MFPFATLQAVGRIKPGKMLDIGCGKGLVASRFADAGYEIDAIDPEEPDGDNFPSQVTFQRTPFEEFRSDARYDLIVASMVSQFLSLSTREFLLRIRELLEDDGTVYLTLLGEEDEWASNSNIQTIRIEEAIATISDLGFSTLYKSIEWEQGFLYSGDPKYWHIHTFVLTRQSENSLGVQPMALNPDKKSRAFAKRGGG